MFVKTWPLEYQKEIKTYLPTYLWDNSDSSDSHESGDSSDSSDKSDSSDSSDNSDQNAFFLFKKLFFTQKKNHNFLL